MGAGRPLRRRRNVARRILAPACGVRADSSRTQFCSQGSAAGAGVDWSLSGPGYVSEDADTAFFLTLGELAVADNGDYHDIDSRVDDYLQDFPGLGELLESGEVSRPTEGWLAEKLSGIEYIEPGGALGDDGIALQQLLTAVRDSINSRQLVLSSPPRVFRNGGSPSGPGPTRMTTASLWTQTALDRWRQAERSRWPGSTGIASAWPVRHRCVAEALARHVPVAQ